MRFRNAVRVLVLCFAAACTIPVEAPVQRQEYYVNDKPVSEEVYRAARFNNEAIPLIEANRLDEARIKLTAAVRLAPDYYHAHYNLGFLLLRLKREKDASEHFSRIVAAEADFPEAWESLGTIYMNSGRYKEAVAIFSDGFRRFSAKTWEQIPGFYMNFGVALGKVGRTEDAIEMLKLALSAESERPFVWMNLAAFYQTSGKIEESIAHYREFIKRAPRNDPDALLAADRVKILEEELREARAINVRRDEEYYFEVTKDRPNIWLSMSMPIRVHIRSGDGVPGFQPRFTELLRAAFQEWLSAAEGKVSIRFVDGAAIADIECLWTDDPAKLQNRAEGGEAQVEFQDGLILRATIIILTVRPNEINPITDNAIKSVALHEVGHALGLLGHSANPRDVMFFSSGIADQNPPLSSRDRKTLLRLYSQAK